MRRKTKLRSIDGAIDGHPVSSPCSFFALVLTYRKRTSQKNEYIILVTNPLSAITSFQVVIGRGTV
jgi:hypothetical protein